MPSAQTAYLFRHALLRDAAYQLQLPGDRARLHGLAMASIEDLCGGAPADDASVEKPGRLVLKPHPTDAFAEELAAHARLAAAPEATEARYVRRAGWIATRQNRSADAERWWRRQAELSSGAERADALRRAAVAAGDAGKGAESRKLLTEALRAAEAPEAARTHGMVLVNLANLEMQEGDVATAERTYLRALDTFREARDPVSEATALGNLANLYKGTGRPDLAHQAYSQALDLHRSTGESHLEAQVTGNFGTLLKETGRIAEARACFERALAVFRSAGDRRLEGTVMGYLAGLLRDAGETDLAERLFAETLALHRETGNRRAAGPALGHFAILMQQTLRFEQADRLFEEALVLHREFGQRRFEGIALANLALLRSDQGRDAEARPLFEAALEIHREVRDRGSEALAIANLAAVLTREGRLEEARRQFDQALRILRDLRAVRLEGAALCDVALLELALGHPGAASGLWRRGADLLSQVEDAGELSRKTASMKDACAKAGVAPFEGQV
ncbi:MAG: tetratricopeptide repeat protein [Planctomycetota bacterium]